MSTHIKMIVYQSLALLAVFGWHFSTVLGYFGSPPQSQVEFMIRFAIIVIAFIGVSSITAVMVSKHDEEALMPDEREEQIELKVERIGLLVAYAGMICLMWFVFVPMAPMQIANALLGIMCIVEIFKIVFGLYYLRRGF